MSKYERPDYDPPFDPLDPRVVTNEQLVKLNDEIKRKTHEDQMRRLRQEQNRHDHR